MIPVYNVRNHHVPIIDRHTYQQVQRIMELKSPHGEYSRYPYFDTNIEFKQDTMQVFWKCGLESEVAMNASKVEEPTHVAELYRNSLDRVQQSENKPVTVVQASVSAEKRVNTREAQRNAAMQAAKNLRAKKNAVASNC